MNRKDSTTGEGLLLNGFSTSHASPSSPAVSMKFNPALFEEAEAADPEEYFTNSSVFEVKSVLNRLRCEGMSSFHSAVEVMFLRSDADAKQEELRTMVGCVIA